MNPTNIETVIERIQRLSRMADSAGGASENEIAMANAAIKRLLAEHNLSMANCIAKGERLHVKEGSTELAWNYGKWEQYLQHTVNQICGTKCFYSRRYDGNILKICTVFVGTDADVQVALALYATLRKTVFSMGGKYVRREKNLTGRRASQYSYMLGVANRMYERAKEAAKMDTSKDQETYGALMVVKGQEINAYLQNKSLSNARSKRTSIDGAAYREGYKDGNNVNLNAKGSLQ